MAVYDFSSGFQLLNSGLRSLNDSLQSNYQLGQKQKLGQQLMDDDYNGAAATAAGLGDVDHAVAFKQYGKFQGDSGNLPSIGDGLGGGMSSSPLKPSGADAGYAGSDQPAINSGTMAQGAALYTDKAQLEAYIRQAAVQRGIDPEQALAVARSEGFKTYSGDHDATGNPTSFGPFQLHYAGRGNGMGSGGLGDEFTKATGLNARDPRTVKDQIDFALDQAKAGGWGPWHGWTGDPWAGIKTAGVGGYGAPQTAPRPTAVAHAAVPTLPSVGTPGAPAPVSAPPPSLDRPERRYMAGQIGAPATAAIFAANPATPVGQVVPPGTPLSPQDAAKPTYKYIAEKTAEAASAPVPKPVQVASAVAGIPTPDPAKQVVVSQASATISRALSDMNAPSGPGVPSIVAGAGLPHPTVAAFTPPAAAPAAAAPVAAPAPAAPAPSGPSTSGPATIAVPGYSGTFTRAQAEAASDDDDSTPGTEEWDKAWASNSAAARGAPGGAPGAPGGAPPLAGGAVVAQAAPAPAAPAPTPAQNSQNIADLPWGDPRRVQRRQQVLSGFQRMEATAPPGPFKEYYKSQVAQGQKMLEKEIEASISNSQQTGNQKDYQFYAAQERAAGRTPMSVNDWSHQAPDPTTFKQLITLEERRAHGIQDDDHRVYNLSSKNKAEPVASGGPLVNLDQRAQGKLEETVSGALGKVVEADIIAGSTAFRRKRALDIIHEASLVDPESLNSGPFAEQVLAAKDLFSELTGQQYDGSQGAAAVMKKVGFDLATQMTKAISARPAQQEFIRALQNVPGLEMSTVGRRAMIDILRQEAEQDEKLAILAQDKTLWPKWAEVKRDFYRDPANALISPFRKGANGEGIPLTRDDVQVMAGRAGIKTPYMVPKDMTPEQFRGLGLKSGTEVILPDGRLGYAP